MPAHEQLQEADRRVANAAQSRRMEGQDIQVEVLDVYTAGQ